MAYGYDGGVSEAELVKAANEVLDEDKLDTVQKIKERYWRLGCILETAKARGYCKKLGVRGWIETNLKCSHTHGYSCMKAWKNRHDFNDAIKWYETGNTSWKPQRATGPTFANELVEAYRKRNDPEQPPKQKKSRAGDAAKTALTWRARFERLAAEHKKWAEQDGREATVLNQIEQEIAAEDGTIVTAQEQQPVEPVEKEQQPKKSTARKRKQQPEQQAA